LHKRSAIAGKGPIGISAGDIKVGGLVCKTTGVVILEVAAVILSSLVVGFSFLALHRYSWFRIEI